MKFPGSFGDPALSKNGGKNFHMAKSHGEFLLKDNEFVMYLIE